MNELILKLFKAVEVSSETTRKCPKDILNATIRSGFVFSPEVVGNYNDTQLVELSKLVTKTLALTPEQMNSSFHKSWGKVATASIETLVAEQIVHYLTTYGFESLGIYNSEYVYIPAEALEIPNIDSDKIKLTVIKGYTKDQIKSKVLELAQSGVALKSDTVADLLKLCVYTEVSSEEIETVRNRELKVSLYDTFNLVPANPVEFLRYLVYKTTETTLLIKNKKLVALIKEKKQNGLTFRLFNLYLSMNGYQPLSEIFHRYKPLLLAFKGDSEVNSMINKVRRLADKYHKALPEDYLNNVTSKLKKGIKIDGNELSKVLASSNIFRKIRLAYALQYRLSPADSIVYKIRNGKSFAEDFKFEGLIPDLIKVLIAVRSSIASSLDVKGTKIYVPDNVEYALPATEKQFTGNVPSGSYITAKSDITTGVYWENVNGTRIDLDLSLISADGKYGWDRSYRSGAGDILFSGDITDASKGAAEHFSIKRQSEKQFLLFVNYYNHEEEVEVPFKIIFAKNGNQLQANHMVDPNDVIALVPSLIKEKQKVLGLVSINDEECRFYFTESEIGNSITSGNSEMTEKMRNYFVNFYRNQFSLKEILLEAGAIFVENKEDAEIDLSIEALEKSTILNLLKGKK